MKASSGRSGPMARLKTLIGIGGVVAIAAGGAFLAFDGAVPGGRLQAANPPAQGAQPQGIPVPVAPVLRQTVPLHLEYVATTESVRSVSLQAKVTGSRAERPLADGADVKQGDLLYRIDPKDYQAALDQAKAQ